MGTRDWTGTRLKGLAVGYYRLDSTRTNACRLILKTLKVLCGKVEDLKVRRSVKGFSWHTFTTVNISQSQSL